MQKYDVEFQKRHYFYTMNSAVTCTVISSNPYNPSAGLLCRWII